MNDTIAKSRGRLAPGLPTGRAILGALQTRGYDGQENPDLYPAPPEKRRWTMINYVLFWWAASFATATWSAGSSLVAVGLTFNQAMATAVAGSFLSGVAMVVTARPGAMYHIGYPTLLRSSFGIWGSYPFIFLRGAVAIVWFGVQTYYSSKLFSVTLRCIFGHKWQDIPNHLPADAGINSRDLVAFFIIWIIQGPLMFIHPSHIKSLWTIKSIIVPPAAFGLYIWFVVKAGGYSKFQVTENPAKGADLAWAVMNGLNAVMGTLSPMILNQPDMARYAKHPADAGWPQGIMMLIVKTLLFLVSISAASATKVMYGVAYWNVWDQLTAILDHNWTPLARTGAAYVSFAMALATIGTNISANSIPFGADMTGLAPRWLTIVRGQVICWILGAAIVPWRFLTDAAKFITFLGSYTVLMAAVLGPLLADYYVIRRGNIHIPSVFDRSPRNSLYWFSGGWNFRAVISWCVGTGLTISGIATQFNPDSVSDVAGKLYILGWLLALISSFATHVALSKIWPVAIYPASHADVPIAWEYLANLREGVFDDEVWSPGGAIEQTPVSSKDEKEPDVEVFVRPV